MGYDDGTTSATYTYDDVYRKTSESVNYGAFQKTYSYTYYNNGMKKTFIDPNGTTYTYTYDTSNQLTGIQIPGIGSITYPSYAWNRTANITLPGGSTKEYTYDPLMRTQSITAKDPGQNPVMNYQYTYDRMDNIVSKVTEHGEYAYGYDELYRLISSDPATGGNEAFTYDATGNRLTANSTSGSWTYNDNNELNAHNDTSYEYDDNGNMVKKTIGGALTSYVYNIEDRLSEVWNGEPETGSLIASYYYDPFGRRLWKEVGGVRRYFLYADEGLIGEYDSTGTEIKTYGYKPSSTWTTDPLFMKQDGNYFFYHNDHLGTPQKMIEVNGAVAWEAKYEAFGKANIEIGTLENNLRFPGQYYDSETGLHYNYNRYYDPQNGRYLSADPIGLDGGINLYLYSENNSIINYDENGLQCKSDDDCLKCITYAESRGTGSTCYKAIAWTIKNRINHSGFGSLSSICDIVSSKGQYDAHNNCNWKRCCGEKDDNCKDNDPDNKELNEVSDALKDLGPDPTDGADSFRSDGLAFSSNKWFIFTEKTVPGCDSFRFFKAEPKPAESKPKK